MLSDTAIENLIQPIITRQENINLFMLLTMAERVNDIGSMSKVDIKRLKLLLQIGTELEGVNKKLLNFCSLQIKDTKNIIKTVAMDTHLNAKPLYTYRNKKFIPYYQNAKIQKYVNTVNNKLSKLFTNLLKSNNIGFLIRDRSNPTKLKFQSIYDTYKSVMEEVIQSVKNDIDYRTSMYTTMEQLINSGIRQFYPESGYSQRLEAVVRRELLEGIRDIEQFIEDENGKNVKADGKELSAHTNCALDHEPFQGHVFTNENFEKLQSGDSFSDIYNNSFEPVVRAIGDYNCRHVAKSVILEIVKPKYTVEKLKKMIQKNHDGIILSTGKHLTLYECSQRQKQLETKVRQAKEKQAVLKKFGDREKARAEQLKINKFIKNLLAFSKLCGLPIKRDKTTISGYKLI